MKSFNIGTRKSVDLTIETSITNNDEFIFYFEMENKIKNGMIVYKGFLPAWCTKFHTGSGYTNICFWDFQGIQIESIG